MCRRGKDCGWICCLKCSVSYTMYKISFFRRGYPLTKTSVIRHKPNIYIYISKEKNNPSSACLHSVYSRWAIFMSCLLQILVPFLAFSRS